MTPAPAAADGPAHNLCLQLEAATSRAEEWEGECKALRKRLDATTLDHDSATQAQAAQTALLEAEITRLQEKVQGLEAAQGPCMRCGHGRSEAGAGECPAGEGLIGHERVASAQAGSRGDPMSEGKTAGESDGEEDAGLLGGRYFKELTSVAVRAGGGGMGHGGVLTSPSAGRVEREVRGGPTLISRPVFAFVAVCLRFMQYDFGVFHSLRLRLHVHSQVYQTFTPSFATNTFLLSSRKGLPACTGRQRGPNRVFQPHSRAKSAGARCVLTITSPITIAPCPALDATTAPLSVFIARFLTLSLPGSTQDRYGACLSSQAFLHAHVAVQGLTCLRLQALSGQARCECSRSGCSLLRVRGTRWLHFSLPHWHTKQTRSSSCKPCRKNGR